MNQEIIDKIMSLGACSGTPEYLATFSTFEECWEKSNWGIDMAWLCGRLSGEPWGEGRKKLVRMLCEIATLTINDKDNKDLELFLRWANGEDIDRGILRAAAHTAYVAAIAAIGATAAYAAYAAASAASANIIRKHYTSQDMLDMLDTLEAK